VNRHLGVHRRISDTMVAGERWITCACGYQVHGHDDNALWAVFEQHPRQHKARP
jgi:hypothetical protein